MIDAATATQAWLQGMQSAGTKYAAGVQAVQTAPGVKAAQQSAVWVQNVAASQQKFARNVAAVSLAEWQQAAVTKGAQRLASGASASQDKMQNALNQILPQIDNIVKSLPPRGDLGQNINRMVAYVQKAAQITVTK